MSTGSLPKYCGFIILSASVISPSVVNAAGACLRNANKSPNNRFTRLFKELRGLPYNDRLSELGLWSLEERRNRADLVEVLKIITGQSSVPASKFFDFNFDTRTRGHSLKLLKHHSAQSIRSHFFSERVINRWNRLPSDVVTVKSINSFKAGLQRVRGTQIDFFMDE